MTATQRYERYDGWAATVRQLVAARGPAALPIDDLRRDDLDQLMWAGGATHVMHVANELARVGAGEVDYLTVRSPAGQPVAAGGVEFAIPPGTAKLMQLVTHPDIRSLGIGTQLITALEHRAVARAHDVVALGVEVTNPRAQMLYQRLGYEEYGSEDTGWEQEDADGRVYWHATRCVLMHKALKERRRR
jgi:ribosomal protein S18 acetylase RimI-like enzyme